MYHFAISAAEPEDFYRELGDAADALTGGETDAIANMANVAALLFEMVPGLNWAGFYRRCGETLVLGPFQGKAACIRIPVGKGVCGAAAASAQTQCVADVHAFPGHIACDAESRSELVVPIIADGKVVAVLDLDSPQAGRFGTADTAGFEALIERIGSRLIESR